MQSSGSDGEDLCGIVPKEIRAAHRGAALALVASALVCLFSVATLVQTENDHASVATASTASVVGLEESSGSRVSPQKLVGDLTGVLGQMRQAEYGLTPNPYHLTTTCPLRASPSRGAEIVDEMPSDVQVFPIKEQGDWVQVIVSSGEMEAASLTANYGWLPKKENGSDLLAKDTEVRFKPKSEYADKPITQEELDAKWDEVRSKNDDLKMQIAELQNMMKDSYTKKVRAEKQKAAHAAKATISEVINVNELSATVKDLHHSLEKELKQPDTLLDKLEHEFLK